MFGLKQTQHDTGRREIKRNHRKIQFVDLLRCGENKPNKKIYNIIRKGEKKSTNTKYEL